MEVHVNENCIGCGLCPSLCPDIFTMTNEGVAAARDEVSPEYSDLVHEAADSCPVDAIEVD